LIRVFSFRPDTLIGVLPIVKSCRPHDQHGHPPQKEGQAALFSHRCAAWLGQDGQSFSSQTARIQAKEKRTCVLDCTWCHAQRPMSKRLAWMPS
jgi:hypothetical protein